MTGILALQNLNNHIFAYPKSPAQINHAALFPPVAIIAPATDDLLPNLAQEVSQHVHVNSPPASETIPSSVLYPAADLYDIYRVGFCDTDLSYLPDGLTPSAWTAVIRDMTMRHNQIGSSAEFFASTWSRQDSSKSSPSPSAQPVDKYKLDASFTSNMAISESILTGPCTRSITRAKNYVLPPPYIPDDTALADQSLPELILSSDDDDGGLVLDDNKDNPSLYVRCSFRPVLRGLFSDDPPSLVSYSEVQANHPHGLPPFHIRHRGETSRSPVRRRRRRNYRLL
jgi:hypothetical protein